ncbi:MAG: hypothetical protein RBT30_03415 [Patescibacteria group bacterium]|jgi:hypothetical protein|nr:hypothetical protein [Patescibacteria group bacterium]
MKTSENPTVGVDYWATICPSHLANDPEMRAMFKPGDIVYYYPETIEILEDEGIVLIGIVPISKSDQSEMTVVPIAKLSFSEPQFVGLLKAIPGLYLHYQRRLKRVDPSLGNKHLPYKEVYTRLKASCLSAQNSFEQASDDEAAENDLEIVEVKFRRLKSLGASKVK